MQGRPPARIVWELHTAHWESEVVKLSLLLLHPTQLPASDLLSSCSRVLEVCLFLSCTELSGVLESVETSLLLRHHHPGCSAGD